MSRSYKHTPSYAQRHDTHTNKKLASRKVRRQKMDLVDGNFYKKIYDSWNILDNKFVAWTRQKIQHTNHTPLPCYRDMVQNYRLRTK